MTLGEERERLAREIENLPWLVRWFMRRRLRKINRKLDRERDRALRRYFKEDADYLTEEE